MDEWRENDRRKTPRFSTEIEAYIDAAAERGAQRAMDLLYAEIGKAGIRKTVLAIGAGVAAFVSWLGFNGHLPK